MKSGFAIALLLALTACAAVSPPVDGAGFRDLPVAP
jgi:hypothetical protein